ncbi:MAG: hypothetical protein ABIO44_01320, partial [Saprospiraceae bacterium]
MKLNLRFLGYLTFALILLNSLEILSAQGSKKPSTKAANVTQAQTAVNSDIKKMDDNYTAFW